MITMLTGLYMKILSFGKVNSESTYVFLMTINESEAINLDESKEGEKRGEYYNYLKNKQQKNKK